MRRENGLWLPTVTADGIYGFFGEYRWLSNFHKSPCTFEGITYPSSEHAYQAAKTEDIEIRKLFLQLPEPKQAKKFGSELELRQGWGYIRDFVMLECLASKFEDVDLANKLVLTGKLYLEETNYWNDTYWGVCKGEGHNQLGKLLMEIRKDEMSRRFQ